MTYVDNARVHGSRPKKIATRFINGCRGAIALLALIGSVFPSQSAVAAVAQGSSTRSSKGSMDDMKYNYEMSVDLAAMYLRETRPGGSSDTGGRLNLGGMFNHWIGLDATGMYELKSKSYLVGGNLRLVPINWFYLKLGGGGYFDKLSREFKATPILGAGFKGYFSEYYYMVAEGLSFQTADSERNIAFGVGLGVIF